VRQTVKTLLAVLRPKPIGSRAGSFDPASAEKATAWKGAGRVPDSRSFSTLRPRWLCVTRVLFQFFDCFHRRQDQELNVAAFGFSFRGPGIVLKSRFEWDWGGHPKH